MPLRCASVAGAAEVAGPWAHECSNVYLNSAGNGQGCRASRWPAWLTGRGANGNGEGMRCNPRQPAARPGPHVSQGRTRHLLAQL